MSRARSRSVARRNQHLTRRLISPVTLSGPSLGVPTLRSSQLAFIIVAMMSLSTLPGGPAGAADAAVQQPSFTRYVAPSTLALAADAAEPTLGVNWNTNVANGGTVMYQSWTATYRVTFDDSVSPPRATWADASSPYSVINVDPISFVDHVKGRTFAGGLDGACSVLSYSDNDGAGWTPMGNSCAGAAWDHPSIGSGPWAGGKPVYALYDRAVYYCAQLSAAQCAVSSDGGLTFGAGVAVPCGYVNPGLHGSVHVASNGWTYLPFKDCAASGNGVSVSKDNGLTWTGRPIPDAAAPSDGFDPDVGSTPSGWAYVAYPTSAWGVGVALTKDGGATWQNFGDVAAAAGVRSSTFHEMVAGDDSRAAVVYLGSTTDGNPHDGKFAGVWHTYVSYTFDAGRTWGTVRASDDVVQRGWICAGGTGCGEGRNLLDFIDAQLDSRGRIVIAIADGCINSCETGGSNSGSGYANIVRQSGGSGLFAAYDPSGPSAPGAPSLSGTAGDGQNGLSWTTPSDGGSAITGYRVYRNGALHATLSVQTSYTDTGVTNGVTYTYQVAAVNAVGEGGKSNSVSLTPLTKSAPSAPQSLTASHAGGPKSGKINLAWQAPASDGNSPITGYKVYRGTSPTSLTLVATVGNVLSWQDTGRAQGVTYHYQVSALNAIGEGPRSNGASAVG